FESQGVSLSAVDVVEHSYEIISQTRVRRKLPI
ncbi:unnamed protein product, partial [marine sediment metagenome]